MLLTNLRVASLKFTTRIALIHTLLTLVTIHEDISDIFFYVYSFFNGDFFDCVTLGSEINVGLE